MIYRIDRVFVLGKINDTACCYMLFLMMCLRHKGYLGRKNSKIRCLVYT